MADSSDTNSIKGEKLATIDDVAAEMGISPVKKGDVVGYLVDDFYKIRLRRVLDSLGTKVSDDRLQTIAENVNNQTKILVERADLNHDGIIINQEMENAIKSFQPKKAVREHVELKDPKDGFGFFRENGKPYSWDKRGELVEISEEQVNKIAEEQGMPYIRKDYMSPAVHVETNGAPMQTPRGKAPLSTQSQSK